MKNEINRIEEIIIMLKSKLNRKLVSSNTDYEEILDISQRLDKYILLYYKMTYKIEEDEA